MTKRNGRKGVHIMSVPRNLKMVPDAVVVDLPYYDDYEAGLATVTSVDCILNLSSVYDPSQQNFAINGQPRGRDQWSALYSNYVVEDVQFSVSARGGSATSVGSVEFAAGISTASGTASVQSVIEESRMKMPFSLLTWNGSPFSYDSKWISLASLFGKTKTQYLADDLFSSVVGASPTNAQYGHFAFTNYDGSTVRVNLMVTCIYRVRFFNPYALGAS